MSIIHHVLELSSVAGSIQFLYTVTLQYIASASRTRLQQVLRVFATFWQTLQLPSLRLITLGGALAAPMLEMKLCLMNRGGTVPVVNEKR
jgi:hypothetical protein